MLLFKQEIQVCRHICQEQDTLIQELNNLINLQKELAICLKTQIKQRLNNTLNIKQEQLDLDMQHNIEQEIVSSTKRADKIEIRVKILKHVLRIIKNQS
jgi:hypothetical protein